MSSKDDRRRKRKAKAKAKANRQAIRWRDLVSEEGPGFYEIHTSNSLLAGRCPHGKGIHFLFTTENRASNFLQSGYFPKDALSSQALVRRVPFEAGKTILQAMLESGKMAYAMLDPVWDSETEHLSGYAFDENFIEVVFRTFQEALEESAKEQLKPGFVFDHPEHGLCEIEAVFKDDTSLCREIGVGTSSWVFVSDAEIAANLGITHSQMLANYRDSEEKGLLAFREVEGGFEYVLNHPKIKAEVEAAMKRLEDDPDLEDEG